MKKIINGKKYDTDTAVEVCSTQNMYNRCDFNYCAYTLYVKKTKEFFLYKETYNGKWIIPEKYIASLNLYDSLGDPIEDASDFVAEYGSVEQYEGSFGEVAE